MSVKPQPKPTQPQSTQPKPNQAKPSQAKPSQPTPTQAKPTTPKPTGQAAPKVSLPKVAGPQTTALTKAPTPQPLGEVTMTAMRNAKQLSTALRQGQTGQELIQKLHSMSPQEQKATLAAMRSSYPAVWKAYQQAKAEGAAPAKPSAAGPSSLDIAKAFGQSMVTETPANLVKFGQGVKQSGVELASGLLSAVKNPAAVAKAIGQQISQSNAKMAAGIYLAGVSSGLLKGNQQAAQDALKKLPAAQAQQAKQQLLSVLSDPKKIGNVTGNALLGVLSDGALSAAGKGVGLAARSATGQAATRTAQQAASAGNRALDSIAQGMFGGKGPKGMTPSLATVGGGMSNVGAGLNLGRQVGQFPKGLGLAGVGAANLMAKGGTDFPNSPHSIGSGGRPALANDAYNPQIVNQRIEQNNTQYPDAVRQNTPQVQSRGTSQPIRPPEDGKLPAFPTAEQVKAKTSVQGGGGLRTRWVDSKGNIYEWDSQHGKVEKYNSRGNHLGEFDPETGVQTKPADPARRTQR